MMKMLCAVLLLALLAVTDDDVVRRQQVELLDEAFHAAIRAATGYRDYILTTEGCLPPDARRNLTGTEVPREDQG